MLSAEVKAGGVCVCWGGYFSSKVMGVLVVPFRGLILWIGTA